MSAIVFAHVTKRYGDTVALNDVSFECRDSEFFTLFGPSGAGKTTTLELIAGIKTDYEGSILMDGRPLEGVPIQERNVAMAFENYALYPHMTVGENIAFPLRSPRARRRSESEIAARVQKAADELGIGQLLDRNPVQLSGGQKQRVSLARALVREPAAYLLDEPIAHLDAKLRTVARANLKEMANRLGTTILYVTHDYREALGLSDRVMVLREGRVEQIGTPREIYDAPATDYVAHLVGDPVMNLVDGAIHEEDGRLVFRGDGIHVNPAAQAEARLRELLKGGERSIRLGIRPADIGVTANADEGDVALPLYGLEHTAHHMIANFELGEGIVAAKILPTEGLSIGQRLGLSFDMEHAHYFTKTFDISK